MVITAQQFDPDERPWPEGVVEGNTISIDAPFAIQTLEGPHLVTPGDFIITGVQGEKYPCKNDIFWQTYDDVTGSDTPAIEIAAKLVNGDRAAEYGSAKDNFQTAADLLKLIRRKDLTAEDIAWVQVCLKLAREGTKHKRDNIIDAIGYLELIDQGRGRE